MNTLRSILAGEQDNDANFRGAVPDGEVFATTWNAASALLAPPRSGFKPYAERQRARLLHEGSHLGLHEHGIHALDSSERGERNRRRVYRQRELLGDFDVAQAYGMDVD